MSIRAAGAAFLEGLALAFGGACVVALVLVVACTDTFDPQVVVTAPDTVYLGVAIEDGSHRGLAVIEEEFGEGTECRLTKVIFSTSAPQIDIWRCWKNTSTTGGSE